MPSKYCLQCFECEGKKSKVEQDKSDYCLECINKYDIQQCDWCLKNKPKILMFDDDTCTNCKWRITRPCENCRVSKPFVFFMNDKKYCAECQFSMKKKCDECGKKCKYYELDNGKYCSECQNKIMLKCNYCNDEYIYSDFYYTQNRIWCKKCAIDLHYIPYKQLLLKYEPVDFSNNFS